MSQLKVLVVDDKRIVGDFFNLVLGCRGHQIKITQQGKEALDLILQESFDIVFVDIVMPQQDGIKILKEIKRISPQLPVVMMSGFSIDEKCEQSLQLGALSFLKKPIELEDVRRIIKEATGKEV